MDTEVHLLHPKHAFIGKNIYYVAKGLLLVSEIDKVWTFDQPLVLEINQFNLLRHKTPEEIPKGDVDY